MVVNLLQDEVISFCRAHSSFRQGRQDICQGMTHFLVFYPVQLEASEVEIGGDALKIEELWLELGKSDNFRPTFKHTG